MLGNQTWVDIAYAAVRRSSLFHRRVVYSSPSHCRVSDWSVQPVIDPPKRPKTVTVHLDDSTHDRRITVVVR